MQVRYVPPPKQDRRVCRQTAASCPRRSHRARRLALEPFPAESVVRQKRAVRAEVIVRGVLRSTQSLSSVTEASCPRHGARQLLLSLLTGAY